MKDADIKEQAMSELESQREAWENRCFKLRVYMRKLTEKCEEWETAFDRQAKLLEALNGKYRALKNSRTETMEVSAHFESAIPAPWVDILTYLQSILVSIVPARDTKR